MPKRCVSGRAPAPKPNGSRATADEIAGRAFELYERRCSIDGWDLDDAFETEAGPVEDRAGKANRQLR